MKTYAEALAEKRRMIDLVRGGPLSANVTDEEIWKLWRELARDEYPMSSAFHVTRALNEGRRAT